MTGCHQSSTSLFSDSQYVFANSDGCLIDVTVLIETKTNEKLVLREATEGT